MEESNLLFYAVQRRVLSEFKQTGKKELSDKYMREKLTKKVGNWSLDVFDAYNSVMFALESCGYISSTKNDGDITHVLKRKRKLNRLLRKTTRYATRGF